MHRWMIVLAALVALPLAAQSNDVTVWGGVARMGSTDATGTTIRFDRGTAYGAGFEHFFGDHLSGELAVFALRNDGSVEIAGSPLFTTGSLQTTPLTATLQWHRARDARFDVFAGGGVAYVRSNSLHSSDLDTLGIGRVDVKSKIGWTMVGGVSYAFVPAFAAVAEARYIGYRPDSGPSDARVRLNLNPLLYLAGVRWRF
ncbi:MAG TPA: OmpW family outer membrane protein [Thermoanaerobaculia bacterium]|nr:OmpW family outer membrane protein [Thermoanaerobaculia bacterium]